MQHRSLNEAVAYLWTQPSSRFPTRKIHAVLLKSLMLGCLRLHTASFLHERLVSLCCRFFGVRQRWASCWRSVWILCHVTYSMTHQEEPPTPKGFLRTHRNCHWGSWKNTVFFTLSLKVKIRERERDSFTFFHQRFHHVVEAPAENANDEDAGFNGNMKC